MQCRRHGDDIVDTIPATPRQGGTNGLALLPHLRVIPHFDFFTSKVPTS